MHLNEYPNEVHPRWWASPTFHVILGPFVVLVMILANGWMVSHDWMYYAEGGALWVTIPGLVFCLFLYHFMRVGISFKVNDVEVDVGYQFFRYGGRGRTVAPDEVDFDAIQQRSTWLTRLLGVQPLFLKDGTGIYVVPWAYDSSRAATLRWMLESKLNIRI